MSDQLEELHVQASAAYLRGDFKAATEAWGKLLESDPTDERAEEGVRLCAQLVGGVDPELGGSAESSAGTDEVVPLDLELPLDDSARPAVDNSAASELTRRVEDLLDSARQQAEGGDRRAALRTLSRILVLDEENQVAQEMQAQLDPGDSEAAAPAEPAAAANEALDLGANLDLSGIDADSGEPILSNVWTPPVEEEATEAPATAEASAEESIPLQSQPEAIEPTDELAPPVAMKPKKARSPRPVAASNKSKLSLPPWLGDRRVQMGVGGLLLLLLVFGGMQFIGGDAAAPVNEPLLTKRTPKQEPKATDPPPPAPVDQAETQPAEAKPVSLADPRKLMQQGEEAYANGDYAAAVVAFGNVLEQVPNDAGVRARLDAAGQRYREQETIRQRWEEAVAAFDSKNFAEALRLIYRMDQDDYQADLARIKVNGWYNHGVNALQMNRCDEAWDHFSEARSLDALDEMILDGLELARACDAPALLAANRTLTFRALED